MFPHIKNSVPVTTRDGVELGGARRLFMRRTPVEPQLKLYAAYLQTRSMESGDDYYIPTDFIVEDPSSDGRITLGVDFKTVAHETWTRMPDFVAHGDADVEELA